MRGVATSIVLVALLAVGCGTWPTPPSRVPLPLPAGRYVSDVRVELSGALEPDRRAALERVDAPEALRLAALDWFEHEGRFDRDGGISLLVEVLQLSLRGPLATWLWPRLARADSLTVRVVVRDAPADAVRAFEWVERTQVGGWAWRDRDTRLDRMARRLGRRIAVLL